MIAQRDKAFLPYARFACRHSRVNWANGGASRG